MQQCVHAHPSLPVVVVVAWSLSHAWLCDLMDCSTPGFPVLCYFPELAQTHVLWVGNAIQPSHPLLSPSPPAFNFPSIMVFSSESLFTSGGQSIGASVSASVLTMNILDRFPLALTGLISLQSKGLSKVFSNTTVQKHEFFSTQLSLWSISYIHTCLHIHVNVKLLSRVRLFPTPWTVAYQAPQSMGFPGKNTGVGCHFHIHTYTYLLIT